MEAKNVLLIQTAFIGDVVLTTPMIAAFKKNFPLHKLSVLVKPEAKSILMNNPAIHEIIIIDKKNKHRGFIGMRNIINDIRKRKFDVLLSPHKSHRTSLLAMRSGIPMRIGYKQAGFSRIAYHKRLDRENNMHEIKRLLSFLDRSLGCDSSQFSCQLNIFTTSDSQKNAKRILRDLDCISPILIAPSSVWATKRWTAFGFANLCRLLIKKYNKKILLVGSHTDSEIADDVLYLIRKFQTERNSRMVHNICGKTNLPELYDIMQTSSFIVSNDSAPVHFACAARLPVIAIFGATSPSLGYGPITKNSIIAQLENLGCRPCGTHGSHQCPQKHFRCMKDISADMVMEKIEKVYF